MDVSNIFMKCGHTANAKVKDPHGDWKPCCVICYGIKEGADEIDYERTNDAELLKERKAKCGDCGRIVQSNTSLAFFEYRKNEEFDDYYCGCRGWD